MQQVNGPFVKPLLELSKQQLVDYMRCRALPWREDASNLSRKYKRNAVRLDLLPLMAQLSGGAQALSSRLCTLAEQSADLRDWIAVEVP